MESNLKSPFDGEPKTIQETDENGGAVLYVAAKALTADAAQAVEVLVLLSMVYLWGLGAHMLWHEPFDAVNIAVFAIAPFLFRSLLRWLWRNPLKRTTTVCFTDKTFSVRRGDRWEIFDRQLSHRFVLLPHDRTQEERDQHEFEKQKASIARTAFMPVRYYGNAFIVCFEYLGQRNDILEVFGPKEAQMILTRFNACDSVMDAQLKKGKSTSFEPADEWAEQPGDIRTLH